MDIKFVSMFPVKNGAAAIIYMYLCVCVRWCVCILCVCTCEAAGLTYILATPCLQYWMVATIFLFAN